MTKLNHIIDLCFCENMKVKVDDFIQSRLSNDYLTCKERNNIYFVLTSFSSREVAFFDSVSCRTVEHHRRNIISKFNVRNTVELRKTFIDFLREHNHT